MCVSVSVSVSWGVYVSVCVRMCEDVCGCMSMSVYMCICVGVSRRIYMCEFMLSMSVRVCERM